MQRGPYKSRSSAHDRAIELRYEGRGYRTIAREIGVPWGTVRNWVSHIEVDIPNAHRIWRRESEKPLKELRTDTAIRRRLIRERGHICQGCGGCKWRGERIPLEVHHENGNHDDNRDENLVLLCANCHSLTPNYRNKKRF